MKRNLDELYDKVKASLNMAYEGHRVASEQSDGVCTLAYEREIANWKGWIDALQPVMGWLQDVVDRERDMSDTTDQKIDALQKDVNLILSQITDLYITNRNIVTFLRLLYDQPGYPDAALGFGKKDGKKGA